MNVTINEYILKKYNLSFEEFVVLYLCAKEINIKDIINSLIEKKIAERNLYDENSAVVSKNSKELINRILVESDKKVIDNDAKFLALAYKMQDLFPKGKKPGTTYYWGGNAPEIAERLKTLVSKFNISFTEEEALDATKKYVESFNGNYKFMHLLKYFIIKYDKNTGTRESDFMTLLENKHEDDSHPGDWILDLK